MQNSDKTDKWSLVVEKVLHNELDSIASVARKICRSDNATTYWASV